MNKIKKSLRTLSPLPLIWCLFLLLIVGSSILPSGSMRKNLLSTAEYYKDKADLELVSQKDSSMALHNYADAILFNIIASTDSSHPLTSSLAASYYHSENSQGWNLYSAVKEKSKPNVNYERYWHGTLPFLRVLLLFTDIHGIRWFNIILLTSLILICIILLIKRKMYGFLMGLLIGLVLCQIWMVPLCIEYFSCFVIFLLSMIFLLRGRQWNHTYEWIFVLSGALICFLDFLTCEILTLFLPLLLLLALEKKTFRSSMQTAFRSGVLWLSSYALTWICKWVLCCLFLGHKLTDIALDQGMYRALGEARVATDHIPQFLSAITVNLSLMFPFKYLTSHAQIWFVFFLLLFAVFCIWYLFRMKETPGAAYVCLLCSFAPFARYAVLNNHSFLHPFFTYRDMLITVTGIAVFSSFLIGTYFSRKKGHLHRRKS